MVKGACKIFQSNQSSCNWAPIVLELADATKDYIVRTDASTEVIGYMLNHVDEDGNEIPITCEGRSTKSVL